LHVDPIYILQDIAIFIFRRFDLKLPIDALFGVLLGDIKELTNPASWLPECNKCDLILI